MILVENLKIRYEEFKKRKNDHLPPTIFEDFKLMCSPATNNSKLFFYIKDESGNERLHHYCYDGIFINYYDPYVSQ